MAGIDANIGHDDVDGVNEASFECSATSVKVLVTLLGCLLHSKSEERVRCNADEGGLLFTSYSRGKSLQVKTSLNKELFESYKFVAGSTTENTQDGDMDEELTFSLDLTLLIECLSVFGQSALSTSSLQMRYVPQTAKLLLAVEENGVMCESAIQVLETEGDDVGQMDFETYFESSAVVGRCIIQSLPLHEAFAELYDLPSAANVMIAMQDPTNPDLVNSSNVSTSSLSLSAKSETGSCEIEFASNSSAFIEYSCSAEAGRCEASFHVAVLQHAFKALTHSNETFLRMNEHGFLSVQHMIETSSGEKAFVDALICPEEIPDEATQ